MIIGQELNFLDTNLLKQTIAIKIKAICPRNKRKNEKSKSEQLLFAYFSVFRGEIFDKILNFEFQIIVDADEL